MKLNSELFIHPADKAAMNALQAIPGFAAFTKAYLSIWNERQYRIMNMSSNLKVSEKQMKKYYDMLFPICEKLGIAVPELYIKLDVKPNAGTYGDTNPFIVVTSGLFETIPENLIPTVLAHECGHIACHHTMFTTMGRMVLNGAMAIPNVASWISLPLQIAFAYWMRCSEFSADRAAAICDATPDKMIQVCMHLAGYDKDIQESASIDAFMEQAAEYREMVMGNAWNRTLEFLMFNQIDHPLNAVRAYDCREWGNSEQFSKICSYLDHRNESNWIIPMVKSAKEFVGEKYEITIGTLHDIGFTNVVSKRTIESTKNVEEHGVCAVSIDGINDFEKNSWFSADSTVEVQYFEAETMEEKIAAHNGFRMIPDSSKKYVGRHYTEVMAELDAAGFTNIIAVGQETRKTIFAKDGAVVRVTIDGQDTFEKSDWFAPEALIRISYTEII